MQAALLTRFGASEAISLGECPKPRPRAGEILVRVQAAAVNPVDWKIRSGQLRLVFRVKPPAVLGMDVAGVVEELGAGVTSFEIGDELLGLAEPSRGSGAFAEYALVRADHAARRPPGLSAESAAALPVAGLSAWHALFGLARVREGLRTLIIGASGGVGHLAVQLARGAGARVHALCGPANLGWVSELGPEAVFDYRRHRLGELPGPYDVVFDAAGVRSYGESARILTPRGAYVSSLPSVGLIAGKLLRKLYTRRSSHALVMPRDAKTLHELARRVAEGSLAVRIDRRYPLERIRDALEYSERGHARGKIVILPARP